jgi:hypothetical protein
LDSGAGEGGVDAAAEVAVDGGVSSPVVCSVDADAAADDKKHTKVKSLRR